MRRIPLVAALLLAAPAAAEPPDYGPRHAVSLHLPALTSSGIAAQYENFVLPRRWSVAGSLGFRRSVSGDYSATNWAVGAELRYWLLGWGQFQLRVADHAMIGPYAAARIDAGLVSVSEEQDDRHVGSSLTLSYSLLAGYRFLFFRQVELTPFAGVVVESERDLSGRLPSELRPRLTFGVTAGWMF